MKPDIENLLNRHLMTLLIVLGFIGLLARIAFVLLTTDIGAIGSMDSKTYHSIAINLIEGKGYSEDGINPSIYVAPLYPFFLMLIYGIFGIEPLAVELVQCFIGVGIALLTYKLAREFFDRMIALMAFIVVLFLPELFVLCTFLYTETLFIFFFLFMLLGAANAWKKPTIRNIAVAGVLCGVTSMIRGVTILFPVILFLSMIFRYRWRQSLRITVVYGLFMVIPILPWTIRNYITFDAFVPIAVGTGDVLWAGNYLPFDGKYNYQKTRDLMDDMTMGMNQVERDKRLTQEALKNISAEPVATLGLMGRKFLRFWFWVYESAPTGKRRSTDTAIQLVLRLTYYPVLALFIIGIYLTRKRWRRLSLFYWLLSYYIALYIILLVVPRYRFPILPILCIFASVSLCYLFRNWFAADREFSKNFVESGTD